MSVIEAPLSLRDRYAATIPAGYSPWLHLAVPSAVALAAIGFAVLTIEQLSLAEASLVPIVWVAANATEWRVHKSLLHRRVRGFELLWERHTPLHHGVFAGDDMPVRSRREWMFVLLPPWAILLILAVTLPITLALLAIGTRDLAALFVATCATYVVSYEWLHLAYHQPPDSLVGRLPPIRWLRRHHAAHHLPERMTRWNFNVTLPLWDLVRGTLYGSVTARGPATRPRS